MHPVDLSKGISSSTLILLSFCLYLKSGVQELPELSVCVKKQIFVYKMFKNLEAHRNKWTGYNGREGLNWLFIVGGRCWVEWFALGMVRKIWTRCKYKRLRAYTLTSVMGVQPLCSLVTRIKLCSSFCSTVTVSFISVYSFRQYTETTIYLSTECFLYFLVNYSVIIQKKVILYYL